MDLVDFHQDTFDAITADYVAFARKLNFNSIVPIPISARFGDNITARSASTPWYSGPTLLEHLETIEPQSDSADEASFRFPVQWVNRLPEFRGYAGTVASGRITVGDRIVVATSGQGSNIKEIVTYDGPRASAAAGDAVTLTLTGEIDVARGDILVMPSASSEVSDQFAANVIWMGEEPLVPGRSYLARIATKTVPITITTLKYRIDPNTREHLAAHTLALNDIGFCNLATSAPVAFDAYERNRRTGSFIIIDRFTNNTVGAGMIAFGLRRGTNLHWQPLLVGKAQRAALLRQKPAIVWFTGLSGAGKSTVANMVEQRLHAAGNHTMLLDGDNIRHGLCRDLGFTEADRVENIRRAGEVAKLMTECGLIVLCSFISPYRAERDMVRSLVQPGEFIEVFVDTPIDECMRRDPKGLYAKARAGQIKNFTGFDAPYEPPQAPEVHLRTVGHQASELAESLLRSLAERGVVVPL